MTLTRYLYYKSAVINSLRESIDESNYEKSAFWAYELYYSGFQKEVIGILVDIYENKFSKNHRKLGIYIRQKIASAKDECIATIVKNLTMKRPNIVETADTKFVNVKEYHIAPFKTLDPADYKYKWKYLQTACKYAVCKEEFDNEEIIERSDMFKYNWLYAASLSPIWQTRIIKYGGTVNNISVIFASEECEDEFYNDYGLEPDEQPLEIQNRCIGTVGTVGTVRT